MIYKHVEKERMIFRIVILLYIYFWDGNFFIGILCTNYDNVFKHLLTFSHYIECTNFDNVFKDLLIDILIFTDGNRNSAEKMSFEAMLPIRSSEKAISS